MSARWYRHQAQIAQIGVSQSRLASLDQPTPGLADLRPLWSFRVAELAGQESPSAHRNCPNKHDVAEHDDTPGQIENALMNSVNGKPLADVVGLGPWPQTPNPATDLNSPVLQSGFVT
jgi:hypothetical protein